MQFSPLRLIAMWMLLFVFVGMGNLMGQSTFSWNNGTFGGTGTNRTFTGNAVSGVTMTATIVNSEDVWQESSPRWIASGSTSSLGTSCAALTTTNQGLLLSTNWTTNSTKTITTTINFNSPVRGPVKFFVYDINDDGYGSIHEQVEVSSLNSSNSSINVSRNTACVPNVSGNNTSTLILNSGNSSSSCTCWGTNEVVVGGTNDCISSVTIKYRSMTGSYNNPAQYIVISNLTGTIQPATAPTGITGNTSICSGSSTTLTATGGTATSQWFTGSCGGTLVGTGASITVSPTSTTTYYVRNFSTPCGYSTCASTTVSVTPPIDFANTQFPTSATICTGGSQTIYGKTFINGVTASAGATTGLVVELGYSTTNSNPNTWTNWQAATFNAQVVNDDEYVSTLTGLAAGTYYYAFRYSYNGCAYTYGGTGGIWSSNSGILTVNDCFGIFASAPNLNSCNTTVSSQGPYYNSTGTGSNMINSAGTNYNSYNFGTYFANSNGLVLKGGELKTFKSATGNVCSAKMYYRIYSGTPSGAFSQINLPYYDGCVSGTFPTGGPCNSGDQKWRDVSQNIDLTTFSAGTYTLEVYYEITGSHLSSSSCGTTMVLNNSGANYTSTFTLVAQASASNTGSYCEGTGTVSLSASIGGTSYSWSGPSSFASSTQNPTNGSPSSSNAGTYTVTMNVGGCTQTASTSVVVNPAASVLANSNSPFCTGQAINLTATDGFATYAWSGPNSFSSSSQNPSISNAQAVNAGTYTLTVTDGNGCQATSSTVVSLTTSPTAANNGPVCVGGALSLSTNSATSYSWSGPNSFTSSVQNPTVSASSTTAMAGTYTVSIVGGCAASTGVVDNFSDGNFTSNPTWTVSSGGWQIYNISSTQYLYGDNAATVDIITTPSTQAYGTWNFDFSLQTTASTVSQVVRFFVTASSTGLSTTNGYYVFIDGGGNLFFRKLTAGTATTLITSTWTANTSWHTVKVIRDFDNTFKLYLDGVLKGTSAADNSFTTSSFMGAWNSGAIASDNHRLDNISSTLPASATTTVVVNSGPSISNKTGTICSGGTYTLATASPDIVPVGTTYSWTFTANPNITGAALGAAQSSFVQTLTNTSSMPQTIVYSVTPSAGGCSGTAFNVTITVDAPLNGGTVSTDQTICSGGTPNLLTNTLLPSGGNGLGIAGSVQIGTQIWMNRNLDVVNYNDGTPVGTVFNTTVGAYTWYLDDYPTWGQHYGALYNWYAVNTGKLCPSGWHVPTLAEYTTLINLASGSTTAGKKLKSCRTVTFGCPTNQDPRWNANSSAFGTDDFGFAALPAGREYWNSGAKQFERVQTRARFWTSTVNDASNARAIEMNYNTSDAPDAVYPYSDGYSVRCMGDNATTIQNSYTYQWQQDPGCTGTWSNISGANSLTYQPGALTQTTCFRRVTTDACGTAYSNTITITVTPGPIIPAITTTICSGQTFSVTPVNGTNGTVPLGTTYTWSAPVMSGVTGGTAQATAQTSISQTLTNTTTSNGTATYTVTATTGTCTSTFTVTVTVLPALVAGTVQPISTSGGGPSNLVIYQVYGGGGNSGATYTNDFVSLYNPTGSAVNLSGWSLQYVNTSGNFTSGAANQLNLTGTIQSGGYFLVQLAAGLTPSGSLPTPDQSGSIAMAGNNGKLLLVNSTTTLSGACPSSATIIDKVGYGTGECFEGTSAVSALNATKWATRKLNGCQDTDVNSADFTVANTTAPKSSASPTNFCTTISNTETICAGQNASNITSTPASGANGTFTYQWYSQVGDVACPTGSSTAGWTLIPGETNLTYSPGMVSSTTTYALFITPTGAASCSGTWATDCRKVIVNPSPIVTDMTTTICSGTAFSGTPVNITNGTVPIGTTYTWTVATNSNVTGQSAQATAQSSITQTLTNTTTTSQTVVYMVTPTFGTCVGATFTLTVTINPKPIMTSANLAVCTPNSFSYTPTGTSIPSGTTYSWSAPSGVNFTGGASGSGATTIGGALTLSSGSSATAVYIITPSSGSCSGSSFTLTIDLSNCAPPTPFTACNLVVYKVGDGSSTLSSNAAFPVSVQEISTTGAVVQTISNLFVGANLLTQGGTSASSGYLNSNNGYLAVPGLNSALGTASAPNENTKVTHIIDGTSTLISRTLHPTTGTMPFTANTYRSVVPVSATTFYCAGTGTPSSTGGVWYYDGSSFVQIYITQTNIRNLEIFNGNLYFSTGTGSARGVYQIGTGLPTTSGQTATLQFSNDQANSSIYNFSISPDGCTAYLADDGTGSTALAGITKFTKSGGVWSSVLTYTTSGSTRGLVVDYSGSNPKIYATTAPSNGVVCNTLISLTDNGASFNSNWTLSAGLNYSFAGVDFTPNSTAAIANPITTQPIASANLCNTQTQTLSVTASGSPTYQWYSNSVNSICGATPISGAVNATYSPPTTGIDGTVYYFVKVSVNCSQIFLSNISAITTIINSTPTATNNGPICLGGTLTLQTPTVSGATYSWTGPNSFASSTQNPTVTTNASSIHQGTYSIITTVNGCPSLSGTTSVSITTSPSLIFLSPP